MSELNITIDGGTSKKLLTAGKFCDKNIVVTATGGGGSGTIEALDITANGTYTAPEGVDGYSPITVNVPQDGSPPESAFVISLNCIYRFYNGYWDWFIEQYGDKITTVNIDNASWMFSGSNISEIPFEINFVSGGANCEQMFGFTSKLQSIPSIDFKQLDGYKKCEYMFQGAGAKEIGVIKNLFPESFEHFFYRCKYLQKLPEFENLKMTRVQTYMYANSAMIFNGCYSLRSIPEDFLKNFYGVWEAYFYCFLCGAFNECYSLNELKGLNPQTGTITGNIFKNTFDYCCRLKNIVFALQDDGTPYSVNWKSQIIDLTFAVGYGGAADKTYILNYNSGITADKEVTDGASYQALKDDPDWFTCNIAYSRYNHDSAVATINSLPDTSAYLATAGGTNTIKFKGNAGSATDGGAINTLTEEEIAVATAKGWTVTLS